MQNTNSQYGKKIAYPRGRGGTLRRYGSAEERRGGPGAHRLSNQDALELELTLARSAKGHDPSAFYRLRSVPGIGKILALAILYEIHDIGRFPRVQDFVSCCRLVKCAKESAGKKYGYTGKKIGNAFLKWAFSEAAVLLPNAAIPMRNAT